MGWRFRKRINIAPGVNLNLSKSGISTTIGKKGASVNIGKNGTYLNTSIPGTGLYSRQKISSNYKSTKAYVSRNNDGNSNGGFFKPRNTWGCVFRWLGLIAIFYLIVNLFQLIRGHFDNSQTNKDALMVWGVVAALFVIVCVAPLTLIISILPPFSFR